MAIKLKGKAGCSHRAASVKEEAITARALTSWNCAQSRFQLGWLRCQAPFIEVVECNGRATTIRLLPTYWN